MGGIKYTVNFLVEQKAAFAAFFPLCPFPELHFIKD